MVGLFTLAPSQNDNVRLLVQNRKWTKATAALTKHRVLLSVPERGSFIKAGVQRGRRGLHRIQGIEK